MAVSLMPVHVLSPCNFYLLILKKKIAEKYNKEMVIFLFKGILLISKGHKLKLWLDYWVF